MEKARVLRGWRILVFNTVGNPSFDRKLIDRTPIHRKLIWPKKKLAKGRLTVSTFDKNVIKPKKVGHKVIWSLCHSTESFFGKRTFHSIVLFVCLTFLVAARYYARKIAF
jgi:hypothetical protein